MGTEELGGYGAEQKKTPKEWAEYLGREHEPITLMEYMAGCLGRLVSLQAAGTAAVEHTEGMIGALDSLAEYIAKSSGIPYASSGTVREALDIQRDIHRKQIQEKNDG